MRRERETEKARGAGRRVPAGEETELTQTVEAQRPRVPGCWSVTPPADPPMGGPSKGEGHGCQDRPTLANSNSVGASRDGHTSKGDVYCVDTLHGGLVAAAVCAVAPGFQLWLYSALLACRVLDHDLYLT